MYEWNPIDLSEIFSRNNLITGILNWESYVVHMWASLKALKNIHNKSISKEFSLLFEHPMSSLLCKQVMY